MKITLWKRMICAAIAGITLQFSHDYNFLYGASLYWSIMALMPNDII